MFDTLKFESKTESARKNVFIYFGRAIQNYLTKIGKPRNIPKTKDLIYYFEDPDIEEYLKGEAVFEILSETQFDKENQKILRIIQLLDFSSGNLDGYVHKNVQMKKLKKKKKGLRPEQTSESDHFSEHQIPKNTINFYSPESLNVKNEVKQEAEIPNLEMIKNDFETRMRKQEEGLKESINEFFKALINGHRNSLQQKFEKLCCEWALFNKI